MNILRIKSVSQKNFGQFVNSVWVVSVEENFVQIQDFVPTTSVGNLVRITPNACVTESVVF